MPLREGAEFAGYSIIRLLGSGGMGEVYLAQHPRLPRLEALKILPQSVSANAEFRERFAREADMAAALWHPHIVAVHDRGECDGQLWIAMDYVEGADAARLIRDRYPYGMPAKDALEIVSAIGDALDYAHERYLMHRDVKPANILIAQGRAGDRRILLADFGIAKAVNENHGLTATNMTVGSVAYAAPEQLRGDRIDGRADQYALACTAFHLLTGRQPFVNSNPAAVIGSHISATPPSLSSVRSDLASMDGAMNRGLAKSPLDRFDTCREFALALGHGDAAWAVSTAGTQMALSTYPPAPRGTEPQLPVASSTTSSRSMNSAAVVVLAVTALLAVGVIAFVGAKLAQQTSPQQSAGPTESPGPAWDEREPSVIPPPRTETVTETATVNPPPAAPPPRPLPPPSRTAAPSAPAGDLGLRTPMSRPLCNGQGIVVLGNVTTPGQYAQGIQDLLNRYPGASYLRTDQSCPSLRQADDEGDPIYAVYRTAGFSAAEVCRGVRAAGGGAYGKWLDYTTPPSYIIPC
ncbi:serine/threonine-protein kinase [Mycobacterium sp. pV006]|uniref:serine/threonine-protein kinase n=1 Tax=Mycobacterium sp. pV006 TaxID=3238983 RepID=UPI00351B4DA1